MISYLFTFSFTIFFFFFFFNDTATTEIYTLSLHDALPILRNRPSYRDQQAIRPVFSLQPGVDFVRSEEHTSELQLLAYIVCRLLLDKKKSESIAVRKNIVKETEDVHAQRKEKR